MRTTGMISYENKNDTYIAYWKYAEISSLSVNYCAKYGKCIHWEQVKQLDFSLVINTNLSSYEVPNVISNVK